jgi:hypothetical protein
VSEIVVDPMLIPLPEIERVDVAAVEFRPKPVLEDQAEGNASRPDRQSGKLPIPSAVIVEPSETSRLSSE